MSCHKKNLIIIYLLQLDNKKYFFFLRMIVFLCVCELDFDYNIIKLKKVLFVFETIL